MISTLEIRQLALRYSELRTRSASREARLSMSLERVGQRVPVVVSTTGDEHVLLDGYKRVRVLKRLGVDTVSAFCWSLQEDEGLLVQRMLQEGSAPNALEMGWLLLELRNRFGHSESELARRLCKSKSFVSRCLGLVEALPQQIQQWVRDGRVSAWAAMKFLVPLARANPADAEQLAGWIAQRRPSTREVASLYAAYQSATGEGRAWLLQNPAAALKAAPKRVVTAEDVARDAEMMFDASVRLRRRVHLLRGEGGAVLLARHHISQTLTEVSAIEKSLASVGEALVQSP